MKERGGWYNLTEKGDGLMGSARRCFLGEFVLPDHVVRKAEILHNLLTRPLIDLGLPPGTIDQLVEEGYIEFVGEEEYTKEVVKEAEEIIEGKGG